MSKIHDNVDHRKSETASVVHVDNRWPDRHPRSKPRTCATCGAEARLYACGPRCDQHSPAAMRDAVAS